MKKYLYIVLVLLGFLVVGLFGVKTYAVYGTGGSCTSGSSSAPNDADNFPFGFLCGGSNSDTTNAPFSDGSGGASDGFDGAGSPGLGSQYYTVPGSNTMSFSTGFNASDLPCNTKNCTTPARVLVWVTVDANYSTPPVMVNRPGGIVNSGAQINPAGSATVSTDGHITNCPGNGGGSYALTLNNGSSFGAGESGAIYNYYTGEPSDPINASPAYDPVDPNKGQEDCQTEGQMIYWVLSNVSGNAKPRFNFKVNVNANNSGQYAAFCVRENISVQYPNGASNSFQNFAKHLAKQSKKHCYQVAPRVPVGTMTAECRNLTVNNGGATFGASRYRTNTIVNVSNVNQLIGAGFTEGNSTGGFPISGQQNGIVGFNQSKTFNPYVPTAQTITITTYNIYHNTSTGRWHRVVGSTVTRTITCATATCSISVSGDYGGNVLAGGTMHVSATITNTSPGAPAQGVPPQPLPDPMGGYSLGFQVNGGAGGIPINTALAAPGLPGSSYTKTFDLPAASSVTLTPRYLGHFQLGGDCSTPVNLYYQFHLIPHATVCTASGCSEENPQNIDYRTFVENTGSNVNNVPIYSDAVYTAYGSPASPPDGQWVTNKNFQSGSPPGNNVIANRFGSRPSINAGDTYCSKVVLTSFTDGLVDSSGNVLAGSTSTVGPKIDGSGHAYDQQCIIVHNEPYFRAINSGVSAGGNFASAGSGCPNTPGIIASWNNNTGINPSTGAPEPIDYMGKGAAADNAIIAQGQITGFNSAVNRNSLITGSVPALVNGTALTFANRNVGLTSDTNSPLMGGSFGGNHCIKKLQQPAPNPLPMAGGNKAMPLNSAAITSGQYTHTGDVEFSLGNGNITGVKNIEIFIDGNVSITDDIFYAGGGSPGNATTFTLHATGNIYIDKDVDTLAGYYVAEGNGVNTGKIYTCSLGFVPVAPSNMFGCNKQLSVYGAFAANQINLMRSYGSLRNAWTVPTCANSAIPGNTSCGAEVFIFSPELYLGKPAGGVTTDWGKYDQIKNLPPVL